MKILNFYFIKLKIIVIHNSVYYKEKFTLIKCFYHFFSETPIFYILIKLITFCFLIEILIYIDILYTKFKIFLVNTL